MLGVLSARTAYILSFVSDLGVYAAAQRLRITIQARLVDASTHTISPRPQLPSKNPPVKFTQLNLVCVRLLARSEYDSVLQYDSLPAVAVYSFAQTPDCLQVAAQSERVLQSRHWNRQVERVGVSGRRRVRCTGGMRLRLGGRVGRRCDG